MNKRQAGLILIIAGILFILILNSKISSMPPNVLMRLPDIQKKQATIAIYRGMQFLSVIGALVGAWLIARKEGDLT
jgi:hypothetical protein